MAVGRFDYDSDANKLTCDGGDGGGGGPEHRPAGLSEPLADRQREAGRQRGGETGRWGGREAERRRVCDGRDEQCSVRWKEMR